MSRSARSSCLIECGTAVTTRVKTADIRRDGQTFVLTDSNVQQSPDKPLPPYSYVPGKFPHPVRDPRGHSHGLAAETVQSVDPEKWHECAAYLHGIDLFNHGYYWEAHESWEAVWHAVDRKGLVADFCKALIKLAAAGVKAREGRSRGVKLHARRAKELFTSVASKLSVGQTRFMGLDVPRLIETAERLAQAPEAIVDTSDEPVVVVMPLRLQTRDDA